MSDFSIRSRGGVSRRGFLKLFIALGGGAAAIAASGPETALAAEAPAYPDSLTFAVMSDVHLFAPELWSDCPDYTTAENSDRKMFRESDDIVDKALADIVAAKPDIVFVPGDLTKDGEYACHESLKEKFAAARQQLASAGVDTQFYVINGNHDLNNHHGKDFSSGAAADAERTDPLTYKSLWAECGYTDTVVYDADGTADGSLSYVAHPCPGLTLIAVDTCKYNVAADDGTLAQETSGHVSAELLAWVCDQAREARAAGDVVIAFQHHGIVPHFGYEPVIFGEYLVDDYETVAKAYAEAGISAVFTGHMHANDIAAATYGENTIYDIETGSLVTYPSRMRFGSLEFAQKGEKLECTLTVDSHDLGDVTLEECGLATTAGITAYGKERTLTVDSIQTMLGGMFVQPLLAQYAPLGIKGIIASLLPSLGGEAFAGVTADNLNATLWSLITTQVLPQGFDVGIVIPDVSVVGDVHIYYNAETSRIEAWTVTETEDVAAIADVTYTLPEAVSRQFAADLAQVPATMAVEPNVCLLYITQETFDAFLEKTYGEIDLETLSAEGQAKLLSIVNLLVRLLITAAVDDVPHSLLDLVDFCYQAHLMGCEKTEGWVETAIEAIPGETGLLASVVTSGINAGLADQEFVDFATSIELDAKTLLKSDVFLIGSIAINMVAGMMENVKALLDTVVDMAGLDLGATLAGLLIGLDLMGQPVPALAQNTLDTLVHDTNVTEDHDFSLEASVTVPSDPDDDSDQDVVDKSGLQAVVDQAEGLELAGASQAALDQYYAALAAALRVMSDPSATEAQVAKAHADLATAIEAVEKSQSAQGGNDDQGGDDDQGGNTGDDAQGGNDGQGGDNGQGGNTSNDAQGGNDGQGGDNGDDAQGGNTGDDAQGGNNGQGGNGDSGNGAGSAGGGSQSGAGNAGSSGSGGTLPQAGDASNMAAVAAAAVLGGAALAAGLGARVEGEPEE